jgi:Domain of unknown function (DUF4070)
VLAELDYNERVELCLSRSKPRGRQRLTYGNARALLTSVVLQGVFSKNRLSYWKFLLAAITRYRHSLGAAVTLAVMGYPFQVTTRKLSKARVPVNLVVLHPQEPAGIGGARDLVAS